MEMVRDSTALRMLISGHYTTLVILRMNILLWILFGGIAGWVASLIVGTDGQMGLLGNVVFGIAGAFVGGQLANIMGEKGDPRGERPTTLVAFLWAVAGACLLLFIVNLIW